MTHSCPTGSHIGRILIKTIKSEIQLLIRCLYGYTIYLTQFQFPSLLQKLLRHSFFQRAEAFSQIFLILCMSYLKADCLTFTRCQLTGTFQCIAELFHTSIRIRASAMLTEGLRRILGSICSDKSIFTSIETDDLTIAAHIAIGKPRLFRTDFADNPGTQGVILFVKLCRITVISLRTVNMICFCGTIANHT